MTSHNGGIPTGLSRDLAKQRDWQRRGAAKYAAKRRLAHNQARLTTKIGSPRPQRSSNDWPAAVRKLARKRSGGICEVDGRRQAVHLHHRKLRRFGDHRIQNALHVCNWCHDFIHGKNNGTIAHSKEMGWYVPSTGDPSKVTVMVAPGEIVLLSQSGHYEAAA